MINHITVALVHAVGRVMGLNQCFLITLGRNVEIPISQSFRPLCGLTFTWDGAFERNSRIGCFQPQHDLGGIHIYTDCHSGYKVRDAFIFNETDNLLSESFLRFMQRSSSSLKPNGRFCGRCPVKAQVFILFFISLLCIRDCSYVSNT